MKDRLAESRDRLMEIEPSAHTDHGGERRRIRCRGEADDLGGVCFGQPVGDAFEQRAQGRGRENGQPAEDRFQRRGAQLAEHFRHLRLGRDRGASSSDWISWLTMAGSLRSADEALQPLPLSRGNPRCFPTAAGIRA